MGVDERARRIARDVVARLAPEELVFFDAAGEAFSRDGGTAPAKAGRDPLAFGITEVVTLVTPIALAVSVAVLDEVLGRTASSVVDQGKRGALWLRGKLGKDRPALPARVEFDERELARIRTLAADKARALGLPEDQVELFVDALIGSLVRPDDGAEG